MSKISNFLKFVITKIACLADHNIWFNVSRFCEISCEIPGKTPCGTGKRTLMDKCSHFTKKCIYPNKTLNMKMEF